MTRPPPRSPLFPYTTLFRSTFKLSPDPQFIEKVRDIVGLYLNPPDADRKSTRLNSTHAYISYSLFFFLNDPAPPEISPLPLHDALPIYVQALPRPAVHREGPRHRRFVPEPARRRSEEHTSELHSRLHLLFPLFFFK